jgi:hypothetical protein
MNIETVIERAKHRAGIVEGQAITADQLRVFTCSVVERCADVADWYYGVDNRTGGEAIRLEVFGAAYD